jgi:hypothetical protein
VTSARRLRARHLGLLALAAGLAGGACGRAAVTGPQPDLAWTLSPGTPVAGPATLTVTLRTPAGAPVAGARIRLEGHMSHPGMAPVVADGTEREPGVYAIPFTFTMPGDWALLVSATLADGARVERRIDVAGVQATR